jgi:hypothetical protein
MADHVDSDEDWGVVRMTVPRGDQVDDVVPLKRFTVLIMGASS